MTSKKHPTIGEQIIEGLEQALAYDRGEHSGGVASFRLRRHKYQQCYSINWRELPVVGAAGADRPPATGVSAKPKVISSRSRM